MPLRYASGIALIVLVFSVRSPSVASDQEPAYVITRVLDAHTFEIEGVGRVRLLGVSRPLDQPHAEQAWQDARKYCQTNLIGKKVKVETDLQKKNEDGQALVYLYLEDGTLFNVELVRAGLATVATNALLHLQKLRAAEEEARQNRRGIWSEEPASEPQPSVESPPAQAAVSTTPEPESRLSGKASADPSAAGAAPAEAKSVDNPAAAKTEVTPAKELVINLDPGADTASPGQKSADSAPAAQGVLPGARLFIEEMDSDLDGFIRAEIVKKQIPLVVVLDVAQADLIMAGSAVTEKRSWIESLPTPLEKDKNTGNVMIFNKDKLMLWASEAGDRSVFWGALKRGGPRKVAERLVANLKKEIQKQAIQKQE